MQNAQTLLIIDDCAEDRRIYRRYLLQDPHHSYEILEADSAKDGLALCQERGCDLILLDFCLPDTSGLDFIDCLKQQKFEKPISAIVLTGRGDEEIAVQAMKRGAQDYLVKQNLKPDVLQLAVRNALKQSCLQAELSKTQERQRLITTTALRIRQSLNLKQILHTAVAEVQQLLKCDRVVVYQFIPDKGGEIVAERAEPSCNVMLGNKIQANGWLEKIGEKHSWACQCIESQLCQAGLSHCCFNLLEQLHMSASLVVPITLSDNGQPTAKPWGLLLAHQCSGERQWLPDELEMLDQVSVQLAIAIQQAELLAQTQAALEKEKHLNVFKSQIVATVAHEYQTPLTSILAAASTLMQHGERLEKSKQQRFLQIIAQKAKYMSKLVDDMLILNQLELDKTKFKPLPLDLLEFFSNLIEEQRELASERHELILKITGNYKGFWGDRGLLRQIFDNLISNAIKYSPNGGNVEVHLMGKELEVIFCVEDRGIGIPSEDRAYLFQSFCRGSNVDTIPGTGLGLAIAKACVQLHGGNITLESQVGKGTKVTVSLPKAVISVCDRDSSATHIMYA